ncbi:hypothetical protein AAVH_11917 [Aphelenchoides avenae]|nr:hypothetical protein AAVH_11917 [Aphelenchus avenae]
MLILSILFQNATEKPSASKLSETPAPQPAPRSGPAKKAPRPWGPLSKRKPTATAEAPDAAAANENQTDKAYLELGTTLVVVGDRQAATTCFGRSHRCLQTQRSIEVVPDAKQLEESHPPRKRLREIEQDFLQGTGPTEFDSYRERRFDARVHQPVVNGIRFRNIA